VENYRETIVSQYANSAVINAVIGSINAAIDPVAAINNWYDLVWNVATAQGYGLDIWGRIVGVTRVLTVAAADFFGFSGPDGGSGDSFDVAPFYSGGVTTSNYALTDDAFRTLIYAKAYANISNGSVPAINNILMVLFGSPALITGSIDGFTMTVTAVIGTILLGQYVNGPGIEGSTIIESQASGAPGGVGVYTVNTSETVPPGSNFTAYCACFVVDNRNMTMVYYFSFKPSPVQLSIIANSGVLPRPCGVSTTVSHF
jgi:hypothetical protein